MNIVETKKALRKLMLKKRAEISFDKKSVHDLSICKELEQLVLNKKYKVVHVYLPMGDEIDITPFIEFCLAHKITVVAPKTLPKRKLQNLILNKIDGVEAGIFGTTHPANSVEYIGDYDLIITPGLAFDNHNFRLGYGGGYYDNFIINHPEANKVGVFYSFQEVEKIPIEDHDLQLDFIIK